MLFLFIYVPISATDMDFDVLERVLEEYPPHLRVVAREFFRRYEKVDGEWVPLTVDDPRFGEFALRMRRVGRER